MTVPMMPDPRPPDEKRLNVALPPSVMAIVRAAGADDPSRGFPFAMASIIGALPWIAVAVFEAMTPDDYREFQKGMKANIEGAWRIIGAENPRATFDAMFAAAKKAIQ